MTSHHETDIALDPELMAYVDGRLEPAKIAALEARLAHDCDAREAVAKWRHFDNLLNSFGRQADELPHNLKIAALERELASKLKKQHWRAVLLGTGLRRIAAGLVLFVAGWGSHAAYTTGGNMLASNSHPYFVAPTLAGHAAYKLASYQGAEFDGDNITSALDWMSQKMQHKIESPMLERLGYRVESARLIEVDDRPVAVFYYRNAENERVTVSVTPKWTEHGNYALRVVDLDDGVMAYWSSDQLHYTVVANENRGAITTLAAAVQQ